MFDVIHYKPDNANPWNTYDMFYQIHDIFKGIPSTSSSPSFDFLPCFSETISKMVEASLPKQEWLPFSISDEATFKTAFFINNFAINSAKLLSSFPCFQRLPEGEKLIFHDRFWQMFMLLRDYFVTFQHFGFNSGFKCLIDNYQYVDSSSAGTSLEVDLENEGSKLFVVPFEAKLTNFGAEFRNLRATFFEFTYICLLALWSFHSKWLLLFEEMVVLCHKYA